MRDGFMNWVSSGDATLAVYLDGEKSKPWLVLSNSLGADASMWDSQIPALTQTHRVARYDTRGHGRSSTSSERPQLDTLAADLLCVMDTLGVPKADILGLSLGGATALAFALSHPERVHKLICAAARVDAPRPFIDVWTSRARAVSARGMRAVVDESVKRWFSHRNPELEEHGRRMLLATSIDGYVGCIHALTQMNFLDDLPSIRLPVLYLAGGADQGIPPEVMQSMASVTPDSELQVIPEAAHLCNMDRPAAFNEAVRRFLAAP
jgi:3-oxoadipate enol-lactonase